MSNVTVACQGTYGANSETACKAVFENNADIMFMKSFEAVFSAVENGLCEYGVLPIENSTYGSVSAVYDLLCRFDVKIVKAVRLPVRHCLAGIQSSERMKIKRAISHEQAIGQCRGYLAKHKIDAEGFANTALAARHIAELGDAELAAICSEDCAQEYGLKILARDIQDSGRNFTRFICIRKNESKLCGSKMSIICSLENRPGSLCELITELSAQGVNMTKIESRPIPETDFEFMFYIDFEGDCEKLAASGLFDRLSSMLAYFRILGCYNEMSV